MDAAWFKQQQKRAGLTSFDLGAALDRDRSVISKILNGYQKMTLDQAKVLADLLQVPLPEMLARGGLTDAPTAQKFASGFAESDATAWLPAPNALAETINTNDIAKAFGARAGVDIWRIKSSAMALAGLLDGDFMLVDTHQAERCRAGDVVIAQVYNPSGATTVLRRYAPPVLLAHSADPADWRVHVVDGVNVVVMGKIVASWRVS